MVTSGAELIAKYGSSPGKYRCFCRNCGSPVYSYRASIPGTVRVRLGTLDGDPGLRPVLHSWMGEKAQWFEITDGLPQFRTGDPESLIAGPGSTGSGGAAQERVSVVLRPPTIQDAQGIAAFMAELGYTSGEQALERVLNDPDHYLLVAEGDGQLLGFINAHFRFHLHHGGLAATIDELVVNQDNRNRGIGRELVQAVIARARSGGAKAVDVSCHVRRTEAHGFYGRCGFERTSYKLIRYL